MSRSWDDDDRMRRIRRDDYDNYGPYEERSGAVTAVGVISIVYGSLASLLGLCFLFCGVVAFGARNNPMFFGPRGFAGFIVVLACVLLAIALGHIFGGIGVLRRGNGSRIFVLVLAGIDALWGIASIAFIVFNFSQPNFGGNREDLVFGTLFNAVSILVHWAFALFAFVVLLKSKNVEEFY